MVFEPAPVVVYDANLLYPFHTRNLFIQLAVEGFVAPRWTDAIHNEWIGNLVEAGVANRERLLRTRDLMKQVLPNAEVRHYEHLIDGLFLPDADDRHVLAAAIQAGAQAIVTFNISDFPTATLRHHGIVATHPDGFLCGLLAADREGIQGVVEAARMNLSHTTPSKSDFVDMIERQGLGGFADLLRRSAP